MHLLLLLGTLCIAWGLRATWVPSRGTWRNRWQQALELFLLPPLLLLMSAIAILCMSTHGHMVWGWEGEFSYRLSQGILLVALGLGLKATWDALQTLTLIRRHPQIELQGHCAHLLNIPELYCAQIGFWQPELVVSQGLLERLDPPHLAAVLIHEQMHVNARDTFWFFGLGWIRRLTVWLPQTEPLWQELLMLRELRADRLAARQVDPLLLAESLLMAVGGPLLHAEICAELSWPATGDRLWTRIELLLADPQPEPRLSYWSYAWLIWVFLPLMLVPFHR
jgi:hypothetical protein